MKKSKYYMCEGRSSKRSILLFLATGLLCFLPVFLFAQTERIVTGTVTDTSNEPLVGVTISVKGSTVGAHTDNDGNFSINADAGATLVASYVGFLRQEISVGNRSKINITLEEDNQLLREVVVIGYGTMEKRAVTSSISSISGKDLVLGMGGATVGTALQGRIAGLTISGNSSPNATNDFQLRGVASVNSSKGPLVVIDGIPGGDIRSLNQEDIESIDVLKDASAGAIYGTRAAGGVILITTKQANDGPIKLTYTGEFSTETVRARPQVLSASEFVEHGLSQDNFGHDTDWYDELLRDNPFSQRHLINLSGGSKAARIYTTFMMQDQKGIVIGDGRKDYSGRMNVNFSLLDGKLEIKTHAEYHEADRDQRANGGLFNMALKLNPTQAAYDASNPTGYNVWTGGWEYFNPVADVNLRENRGKDKWLLADATVKVNINTDLYAQATIGYQGKQWQNYQFVSANHKSSLDNTRRGEAFHEFSKTDDIIFESILSYNKAFGNNVISAVGGYSFFETNGEKFNMRNFDFPVDGLGPWDIGKGTYLSEGRATMSSNKSARERLIAFLGRVNYSFKDRYMATASLRHEGSSKFGKNNKWGNFYSLSGGWRFSEESFLKDIEVINDLKFRVGYGVTGNNGFEAGKSTKMYASDDNWWMTNNVWNYAYGSKHNVNYDLHWEEKKELNFGLDYSLLDNRLFGKLDIYNRKVEGMIYDVFVPVPPSVHDRTTMNAGNLENSGWEFEIGAIPFKTKDFEYTTTMRFSHNESKITSLWGSNTYEDRLGFPGPGSPGTAIRLQAGKNIGEYYIWRYAGIDDNGNWLLYDKNNNVIPAADKKNEDKAFVGNAMPKLIIAWDHTINYKNWDFSIFLRSWIDYDVFNTINMYYGLSNVEGQNVLKDAYSKYAHIKGEKELCDFWLEDGTFLKIDAINIGYNLNLKKYHKYLDKARLYLTVRDVATFTNYSGLNPEVNINGLEPGFEWFNNFKDGVTGIYPQTRRFTLGVQLTF
ncbi:SusC/RagA family TonB-linked outer membrane protein [Dysgonomonas sp. ZJ279]|uniref:SusC/RagA family TonB-linked outer membrane protein n=1 Tax=Dysgonomonas sp. ZJ279 TaxID=2709796 RepID=UPI0013EAD16B|nr:SusC/RagA family TonB-linked outer membrane protein [Dysgonomonas sp. ZJ279]